MSVRTERILPYLLGALAGFIAFGFAGSIEPFPRSPAETTLTLGIIIIGFAGTQRTMLLSLGGTKVLLRAKFLGFSKGGLDLFMQSVWTSLIVVVVSVVWILIAKQESCWLMWAWKPWLALWVGSLVMTLTAMARNEAIMRKIVQNFIEEQETEEQETEEQETEEQKT